MLAARADHVTRTHTTKVDKVITVDIRTVFIVEAYTYRSKENHGLSNGLDVCVCKISQYYK